jgi:hypothetical protein
MDIRDYPTGSIPAEAAFTSDFEIPADIEIQTLVNLLETERRSMDIRPGMRHKYTPLSFDPATGHTRIGGRYLFDTWANVRDYDNFLTNELEFEPGVKFWSRPFFFGVDRHIWRVTGAHDFTPLADTHFVNRLERWTYDGSSDRIVRALDDAWPAVREEAAQQGLASSWLMYQPEEKQIAVLTVADRVKGGTPEQAASASIAALGAKPSLGKLLEVDSTKVFDRTSLILGMWLPKSRLAGGAPSAYPQSPVWPVPTVEPQEIA